MRLHTIIAGTVCLALAGCGGDTPPQTASSQVADTISLDMRCGSHGTTKRETRGTIAGALGGALIGAALGGAKGAAIGGLAGGAVGNRWGAAWDKSACEKAKAARALALSTGATQHWASDDGKIGYTYAIQRRYDRMEKADFRVAEGRDLDLTGFRADPAVVVAMRVVNVRNKPTLAGSQIVTTMAAGTKLGVLGRNPSADWAMVSKTGVAADGWASSALLQSTADDPGAFAKANGERRKIKITRVSVARNCVDTRETLTEGGKPHERSGALCKAADGSWQNA